MAQAELTLRSPHCFASFPKIVVLIGAFHVARAMCMASSHSSSTTAQHSVPALSSEREYPLQSATRSSVWSSCRTDRKYRWMSPTIWWRLAVRRLRLCSYPSRRASIGSTYNSGEDIATTPFIIDNGWKTNFGDAGFTDVDTEERGKCSPTQDLSL